MQELCIICRKESDEFSDEHVIPDSLGGYYHIYSVCKTCNSNMGSYVDSKLVNHSFSEFQRFLLGWKGKSSKLPNPFSGTHSLSEDAEKKIQVRLDKDNNLLPYSVTSVAYEEVEDGLTKVNICVDASDEKKLDDILKKISKKMRVPLEGLEKIDRKVETLERPSIKCSMSIDLDDFKVGLLKIAYEFAVDTVGEYFLDPEAVEISKVLKSADYSSVEKYVALGNGFDHSLFDSLREYIDLECRKHYLILLGTESHGLLCLIHLHGMFSVGVTLSNSSYSETMAVIGVNDIDGKSFRKVSMLDLMTEIFSPPELRFQYYFETENDMREFVELQSQDDFCFFREGDRIPTFDRGGVAMPSDIYEIMKNSEHLVNTEGTDEGGIVNSFPLPDEIFVKILPSGKLVQVVSVREEIRKISKL
ncbi:HNH endonuclease [Onishia niordana]|uniref:HNH endonuclease n=1 Tax=Onishia niordana TaxID=2508711 RepID=UPI001446961B|nr:HNH endonuclease [Halomonas niordiana]